YGRRTRNTSLHAKGLDDIRSESSVLGYFRCLRGGAILAHHKTKQPSRPSPPNRSISSFRSSGQFRTQFYARRIFWSGCQALSVRMHAFQRCQPWITLASDGCVGLTRSTICRILRALTLCALPPFRSQIGPIGKPTNSTFIFEMV